MIYAHVLSRRGTGVKARWTKTLKTNRRGHLICSEIGSICARSSTKRGLERIFSQAPLESRR